MKKQRTMLRLCAWHNKYFGHSLLLGKKLTENEHESTYGICNACKELYEKEIIEFKGVRNEIKR